MRVLVDNGVISSSDFLEGASHLQQLTWGPRTSTVTIAGFRRVQALRDAEQQREVDALFTVGRLAREGRIELFTYSELIAEMWRRPRGREPLLNAFTNCRPQQCPSAIERSRFRMTVNINEWFAKGGNEDRKRGRSATEFNQVPYFQWLAALTSSEIEAVMQRSDAFGLTDFEVESLNDLDWFQSLFRATGSVEKHLPDCFHLWTARRNGLDAFLSIEKTLPRLLDEIKGRRRIPVQVNVQVLRPTDLLSDMGISVPDRVPVEFDQFYSYMEISSLRQALFGE